MAAGAARHGGGARLALVSVPSHAPEPTVSFCSHCATRPQSASASRVCDACGLGLLLQAGAEAVPEIGGAFIVLDASLSVCAVSGAAEQLLVTCETDAVNRHVTELLVPAEAEAEGSQNLAVAVTWAARGDDSMRRVTVRPSNTFGVRMNARITSCGPPRAALVVFE